VTCLNLAGYGLRGAAVGLNNVLGAPLLPPLAFLQGLDLHHNQLWGAALLPPSAPPRSLPAAAVHCLSGGRSRLGARQARCLVVKQREACARRW